MTRPIAKNCIACGRTIEWRRKWKHDWESVKYCSTACRKHGVGEMDRRLEATILELLAGRSQGATICPSEAAQTLYGEHWRPQMERTRMAARRLVNRGEIVITQGGKVVDPSTAKGPVRLRRAVT